MGWKSRLVEPLIWMMGAVSKRGGDPRYVIPQDILVLRLSDLGDLLTATPVFEALRKRFPSTHIVAGVGSWGRPIVENNPFIDEILELDLPFGNKFVRDQSVAAVLQFLWRSPQIAVARQRRGFDVGIDLMGSHAGVLTLLRLGARHRIGLSGYRGGSSSCQQSVSWSSEMHVARLSLKQTELIGVTDLPESRPQLYLTDTERQEARHIWAARQPGAPLQLLVNCGGGLADKCWPVASLGEALRTLSATMDVGFGPPNIILIGGKADRDRAEQVMAFGVPGLRSVCGETSLRITFAITEQADLVLTNASMLLHAAAAFRRPTVAILGGMHSDPTGHDRLWGYSTPYTSVGVTTPGAWPTADQVVTTVLAAAHHQLPLPA